MNESITANSTHTKMTVKLRWTVFAQYIISLNIKTLSFAIVWEEFIVDILKW
jgi:hypothetical protein